MSLYALCLKGNQFSKSTVFLLYHFLEGSLRTTVDFNTCMNGLCCKKSVLQKQGDAG